MKGALIPGQTPAVTLSGDMQSVTGSGGRRSCYEVQGKTISELHRADYRTVSGRTKAGCREVSILPVEE